MIDRETLRNKILINNDKFVLDHYTAYFEGNVDGVDIEITTSGVVKLKYDGVTETIDTFKNVYELLLKHKRDKIHATFGRLEP